MGSAEEEEETSESFKTLLSALREEQMQKERHGKVPIQPTRFQQLCRFVPHEASALPIPSRFWVASAYIHTAWVRTAESNDEHSSRRGDGDQPSPGVIREAVHR
jgi:hypothetical protein